MGQAFHLFGKRARLQPRGQRNRVVESVQVSHRGSSGRSSMAAMTESELAELSSNAKALLADAGAVRDLTLIPMKDLTVDELDDRIAYADNLLADLGGDRGVPPTVRRQLAALDYLIANPDASIPPDWVAADLPDPWPLDDEPEWITPAT